MSKFIRETAGSLNQHNVIYEKQVKQLLTTSMVTEKYMTPKVCEKFWSSPNVQAGDVVQAFQHKFTPGAKKIKFDAVESQLQPLKIEFEYTTAELEEFHNSWMVEWVELGRDIIEWSFPRWMWENVLIKKYEENMETKIAFKGQFVKPIEGKAGFTMNACDGLGVSLLQGIYKGAIVPFQMGNLNKGDEVAHLEDFCNRIPAEYRYMKMPIFCDPDIPSDYYFNRRERFGRDTNYVAGMELPIETFNKTLVPLPSMAGTGLYFSTPQANMVKGLKKGQPANPNIRWYVKDVGRTLQGATEFYRFYNVAFHEEVFLPDTFMKLPDMLPALPNAA